VRTADLPLSPWYRRAEARSADPLARALGGGEDYELAVTVPRRRLPAALAAARRVGVPLTAVGEIVRGSGVRAIDPGGRPHAVPSRGHDHLARPDIAPRRF